MSRVSMPALVAIPHRHLLLALTVLTGVVGCFGPVAAQAPTTQTAVCSEAQNARNMACLLDSWYDVEVIVAIDQLPQIDEDRVKRRLAAEVRTLLGHHFPHMRIDLVDPTEWSRRGWIGNIGSPEIQGRAALTCGVSGMPAREAGKIEMGANCGLVGAGRYRRNENTIDVEFPAVLVDAASFEDRASAAIADALRILSEKIVAARTAP
jgi:hypothetical protein